MLPIIAYTCSEDNIVSFFSEPNEKYDDCFLLFNKDNQELLCVPQIKGTVIDANHLINKLNEEDKNIFAIDKIYYLSLEGKDGVFGIFKGERGWAPN